MKVVEGWRVGECEKELLWEKGKCCGKYEVGVVALSWENFEPLSTPQHLTAFAPSWHVPS